MITEKILQKYPSFVKYLTGLPAENFWELVAKVEAQLPEYDHQRHARPDRQRAAGAGRDYAQSLAVRIAMLLAYLRVHGPQRLIGLLLGGTQSGLSRDLRRLLPLLKPWLPVPEVWQVVAEGEALSAAEVLQGEVLVDGRVLVDATEQTVYRAQENEVRKKYYSGKKKAFTLKTQLVNDGEHHIVAISTAVPGAMHDKKLSDQVDTIARLPEGSDAYVDKGYQGVDKQVQLVTVRNTETGHVQSAPRVTVHIPIKKPKGQELTEEQKALNQQISSIRVRVEHTIGWVKNWAIIATRFRCAHTIYTSVLQVVCGLVNWQTARWQAAKALALG